MVLEADHGRKTKRLRWSFVSIETLFAGVGMLALTGLILSWDLGGSDADCVIKGNISHQTGEKIYHMPGDYYYEATIIDPAIGERWFCSQWDAFWAGWRRTRV